MKLEPFQLETYLGKYEFSAPYLLCCSDAETWSLSEILDLANLQEKRFWEKLQLGYTEVEGLPLLRETIAATFYPDLSKEAILCFAGAEEGIFCCLLTLCQPKDHVVVLTPCYQSLLEVPRFTGCSVTTVPLKEENQWQIDLKAIEEAIQSNTKCLVINFPHNPTGQIITQDQLCRLIRLLEKQGIWLFSDEVYRLLGLENTWAQPAATLYNRAISLGVMSKSFGMAGLRIGWLACQDSMLLKKIKEVKHYTSICSSAPAEIISLIALRNASNLLQRNNAIVRDNVRLVENFLATYAPHFSWVSPKGGCVGFVKAFLKVSVDQFCQRLVKESGVLLLPASVYAMKENYFRIGFGRKNLPMALAKLEEFVQRNQLKLF